ncbi:uncharacterized protein LOC135155861 [Lytechinus pictus]|uniref:uncharacterized protein LOC135155861 n=1 Tax=Lytechinus pictus TaxID=7653 RepID=UPI0030BA0F19
MEGKFTEKGNDALGLDHSSTSILRPSGCDRPSTSNDTVLRADTHLKEPRSDFDCDDAGADKSNGKSRVCFVCRIICILASIAISVFLIVWFSAIEAGLHRRNPLLEMSQSDVSADP